MARVNFVLLLALLTSALYLVHVQYQSRLLYTQLDRAQAEQRRLEHEIDRLRLEQRAQTTPLRVERQAREQLQMRPITPAITQTMSFAIGVGQVPVVAAPSTAPATPSTKVRP